GAGMSPHPTTRTRARSLDAWRQAVAGVLRGYQERGRIEITTPAATHAVLPLLAGAPSLIRAQIEVGTAEYRRYFGRDAAGFWLPECAYEPGLDVELAHLGCRYFVVDTLGLPHPTPHPVSTAYVPVSSSQRSA